MLAGLSSVADAKGSHASCCFALLYTAKTQRSLYIFLRPIALETAFGGGDLKSVFGPSLLSAQRFASDCHCPNLEHWPPLAWSQSRVILQTCLR